MSSSPRSHRVWGIWLIAAGLAVGFCLVVPPFRIVSLEAAREEKRSGAFDAAAYAEDFWSNKLSYVMDQATDAEKLIQAIRRDPGAARKKHARTLEFGRDYYYFVQGSGFVVAADETAISVSCARGGAPDLKIATAHITGNVIQEATGLMDPSDFNSLVEYNNVATEIKRIVEARVLQAFRRQAVGAGTRVNFIGCAELNDELRDPLPLFLMPTVLEVK